MLINSLDELPEFLGGDHTYIREVLRPNRDKIDIPYSIAHAKLEVGKSSLKHILKSSSEVYYIIQGVGKMVINEEEKEVIVGDCIYIPAGSVQHIENVGKVELLFICIVNPAWKEEDEDILL